jgi:hypothetical protein
MAIYQITVEITTRLSREMEAESVEHAERLADELYQTYQRGDNAHVVATEHHKSVALTGHQRDRWRFAPA